MFPQMQSASRYWDASDFSLPDLFPFRADSLLRGVIHRKIIVLSVYFYSSSKLRALSFPFLCIFWWILYGGCSLQGG